MIRKVIASILVSYLELIKKRPFLSILLSLLIMAACIGGLYLIMLKLRTVISMPCVTGGCGH